MRILSALLLFFILQTSFGQFNIQVGLRYETFQMNDLKELHDYISTFSSLGLRHSDNMNSTISQSISLGYFINENVNVGISGGYSYTGSRYSYSDFSGLFISDFQLSRFDLSAFGEYFLTTDKFIDTFIQTEIGVSLSSIDLNSTLDLFNTNSNSASLAFTSRPIFSRIGLGFNKSLDHFFVRFITKYEIDLGGKILLEEDEDFVLLDENNNEVSTDWGGLKLNISFGYLF